MDFVDKITILVARVRKRFERVQTELMLAAYHGQTETVTALLNSGVKVDEKDAKGFTALMYAVSNRQTEVVKQLIMNGAKVNNANSEGITTLMMAAERGHADIVEILLSKRARINVKSNGRTALILSVEAGQAEVVKILVSNGAFYNDKINKHWTALSIAEKHGFEDVQQVLCDHIRNVFSKKRRKKQLDTQSINASMELRECRRCHLKTECQYFSIVITRLVNEKITGSYDYTHYKWTYIKIGEDGAYLCKKCQPEIFLYEDWKGMVSPLILFIFSVLYLISYFNGFVDIGSSTFFNIIEKLLMISPLICVFVIPFFFVWEAFFDKKKLYEYTKQLNIGRISRRYHTDQIWFDVTPSHVGELRLFRPDEYKKLTNA